MINKYILFYYINIIYFYKKLRQKKHNSSFSSKKIYNFGLKILIQG